MRIKRSEILKAIRTEKLKAGSFIHGKDVVDEFGYESYVTDKNCKVCAVGAVLRYKGIDSEDIDNFAGDVTGFYVGIEGDEFQELEDKNYLTALSVKFEKLAKKFGAGKRTRTKLVAFVKRHFPKTIAVKNL